MFRSVLFSGLLISVFFAVGCASTPVQGYLGSAKPSTEVATVVYTGNTFTFNVMVIKVDGRVSEDIGSMPHLYNARPDGNILLNLLPGAHELELELPDAKSVQTLKLNFEAGKTYTLSQEKGVLGITTLEGGKAVPVPFTLVPVAWYQEPAATEPYATLVEDGIPVFGKELYGTAIVYRIDGAPGREFFNRYRFNDFNAGAFSVRVTPGDHVLEFHGQIGKRFQVLTQMQKYHFEAGKTYTIAFETKALAGVDVLAQELKELP